MRREDLGDLVVFLAVAEARSFTQAATQLGASQSALSQTVRRLEARLGVRLLTRTTRSVSPTDAGLRLLERLGPAFAQIGGEIEALSASRDKPAGLVRITTTHHAAETLLWPAIQGLLPDHPDITFELSTDADLRDIVADRFDAGVRLGERVAKDMIALRIGPDLRMAVLGSPGYFARRGTPTTPRDLTAHDCINVRLPGSGGLYAWEFEKDGRALNVRTQGPLVLNDVGLILAAALAGFGLTFQLEDRVRAGVADGRFVRVLEDWCPPFPGHHLYYPSRRELSPALGILIEALRMRSRPWTRL